MERSAVFKQNFQRKISSCMISELQKSNDRKTIAYCLLILFDTHQNQLDLFVFDNFDLDITYFTHTLQVNLKNRPNHSREGILLFNSFFLCYCSQ